MGGTFTRASLSAGVWCQRGPAFTLHQDDLVQVSASNFLPAGATPSPHTTCYSLCCRTSFTCPTCRGDAQVPAGGVVALPSNTRLRRGANLLRQRRETDPTCLTCTSCGTIEGVAACKHCQDAWCQACGATHLRQVHMDIVELRVRLASARDTLDCRVEEEEVSHAHYLALNCLALLPSHAHHIVSIWMPPWHSLLAHI